MNPDDEDWSQETRDLAKKVRAESDREWERDRREYGT